MLVQGFPTVAILRQEMVMLLRVLLKVCGQIVFSQMTDRLLVSDLPVVAFILLGGGRSRWSRRHPSPMLYDAVMNQWTVTCQTV